MPARRISPEEAKSLVDEGWQYLDVRTEAEFAAGHPVGAHNVPYAFAGPSGMTPNPEFVALVTALYGKDAPLVLGCKSGGRSAKAGLLLEAAGFTKLADVKSGFDGARSSFGQVIEKGWAAAGLPVETTTPGGSFTELAAKAKG
jgi:rhodanese-related sulfurtransferase